MLDKHFFRDGYPNPDGYNCANGHHYSGAEPDPSPDRYPLGHLDAEHNAHQYQYPDAHPDSFGYLHPRPYPNAASEPYSLAGPYPNQIKYARNDFRSQPCL